MTPPDLALLHAFAVFAAHRNLPRAARALHVSQPALHAQLARLSDALGVSLYERRGRALQLTADGERVAAFARDVTERAERFVAELHGAAPGQPLVLCAGAGSYLYLLGSPLRVWLAAPPAPLRLLTRDREQTVAAVRSGEAQLGVAPLDEVPAELAVETLAVVPQVLAMPSTHPLASRAKVKLGDLDGARMVLPTPDRPHRQIIDAALRATGARHEVAVEANGWELALRFVEMGVGVSVVSGFCRMPAGVVARPVSDLPAKTYHLVRRREGDRGTARAALRRALLEGCASWR